MAGNSKLAKLYEVMGDYANARLAHERVVASIERNGGAVEASPLLPDSLAAVAACYVMEGRLHEAKRTLTQAVSLAESIWGAENEKTLQPLELLTELMLGSEAARVNHQGSDSSTLIRTLVNLARHYREHRSLASASRLYRRAIRELSPEPAGSLNGDIDSFVNDQTFRCQLRRLSIMLRDTAELMFVERKYSKAEPIAWQTLLLSIRAFGREHIAVAQSLLSLAGIKFRLGHLRQAAELVESAIRIKEALLGANHADIAADYGDLSTIRFAEGNIAEPECITRCALNMAGSGKQGGLKSARVLSNIAEMLNQRKKLDQALSMSNQCLEALASLAERECGTTSSGASQSFSDGLRRAVVEADILSMVDDGADLNEISETLKLTPSTVVRRLETVVNYLGCVSQSEVQWAISTRATC